MRLTMTVDERVRAALRGDSVDRVPLCFWHHFRPGGSGKRLADLTMEFFRQKFDLDIVKIMPDIPYPGPPDPIQDAEQLRFLPRLEPDNTPSFQEQLTCIRVLRQRLGPDFPILLTLFSPFTYITRFMGKQQAIAAVRKDPDPFLEGLGTLSANLRMLITAAIEAGVSGIFFSCMGATTADLTPDEYKRIAQPYDLHALEGAQGGWLNTIHIHADPDQVSDQIYFEQFLDYPVSVMSWSDRVSGPTLGEAFAMTNKCLMGGLAERGPLTHGGEDAIQNEMLAAIAQTNSQRLILANGCSIPDDTPEEWLHVARRLIDTLY
jgi:uroporphyrinogen decarboxylase